MGTSLRPLQIAAGVEMLSLLVLLLNLATVHYPAVASLLGPTHGCAYLVCIIYTFRRKDATPATRATSLIPGIGGMLTLRRFLAMGRVESARV
ncbi:hypothetical protein NDR87_34955 [Nocardia sp. CDC159]|uniref:DUF3817 domain-containing protein n=1 Tax=Nocardia pulmonis TaxID=2951408 RepID=A0A9X2J339_9NOCA|nr:MULTISPECIES: hypothetical protein [Nocardia]MCM6778691.1 hypothetical protein [Nocardia pulmonis]MCM6791580.1 hypothetical protein [Nocardia sp. CDC159]